MSEWRPVSTFVETSFKGITPKYVAVSKTLVLNQKCIRNNSIDYSLAQYTDDIYIPETKIVKKGDIIFNSTGQGTAGRCAFVNEVPKNTVVVTDSHMLILRCRSYYEAKCLNYILYSFEEEIQSFMDGSTGQAELDKVRLFNVLTSIPLNQNTQKKICDILSVFDSKIANNNKINKELETLTGLIFDYWFVQFDFPDAKGKPYKKNNGKMIWNKELKQLIPAGWECVRVENILSKENTTVKIPLSKYSKKGTLPIIDQSAQHIAGFTNNTKALIKGSSPKIVFGDHTRTLKLINFDFARGADGTQIMSSNSKRMPPHLFYYSLSKIDLSSYGYARHYKFLKRSKIILPAEETANKFENLAKSNFELIRRNTFENRVLEESRNFLLPILMKKSN